MGERRPFRAPHTGTRVPRVDGREDEHSGVSAPQRAVASCVAAMYGGLECGEEGVMYGTGDMQSVRCEHCGQMISGKDEDQLVKNIRDHNREMHGIETSEQEAREKVRESARERGRR